jgi:hypothetical protein
MMKTLIGKNNYLFLQNDSNKELEVHNDNLSLVKSNFYLKYEKYISKYLLIVFPNKSFVHKEFLPDKFNLKYRPALDAYQSYFKDHLLDMYPHLNGLDTFYKTDTHMNFHGACVVYSVGMDKIRKLFQLPVESISITIQRKNCTLSELNIGLGDLTWEMNLGNQVLEDRMDTYYYTDDIDMIFMKYIVDRHNENLSFLDYNLINLTHELDGRIVNWEIVSKFILHSKNSAVSLQKKIIIFYDSFLLSSIPLWMKTFSEIYFIKNNFNPELIERIQPDYIFEFRVERFLS